MVTCTGRARGQDAKNEALRLRVYFSHRHTIAVLRLRQPGITFMKSFVARSLFSFGLAIAGRSFAAAVPSLDEMAGDWIPLSIATNLPDVHNFNQMLIVNRDLTSFFCNPGGLFGRGRDPTIQWHAGYGPVLQWSRARESAATRRQRAKK